jgi:hypothetical protein
MRRLLFSYYIEKPVPTPEGENLTDELKAYLRFQKRLMNRQIVETAIVITDRTNNDIDELAKAVEKEVVPNHFRKTGYVLTPLVDGEFLAANETRDFAALYSHLPVVDLRVKK